MSTPLKFNYVEKFGKWVRKKFINYIGSNYDPRNAWSIASSPVFCKLVRETDIAISTYGPEASHVIGSRMKIINPSLFWIADYRDLWSDNISFVDVPKKI